MKNILIQTTIPFVADDWHVGRFSLLADHLRSLRDGDGEALYSVTVRNREDLTETSDPILSTLDSSEFDQLWIFAVDSGDGLTSEDCSGITRFRQKGGGILSARDHNDLGSSLCTIGGVGAAHYFHSRQQDPDESRRQRDNNAASNIDWPNYHSGANGDFQTIDATDHELMRRQDGSLIEFFPAHPHEGGIGAPDETAKVIATGKSQVTDRSFNLVVAFDSSLDDHGNRLGRAIAESSFHHLADYNWDPGLACPTFVEETPGDEYLRSPEKLNDIKQFVQNAALWLSDAK